VDSSSRGREREAGGREERGRAESGTESERKRRQQSRKEGDHGKQHAAAGGREARELQAK